ncbi:MAG TPA: ATP-binding protein [Gemmatimonadales bacterium]|nr:ATP-binding protein [Gemmatimonadales bacterium]
MTFQRKLLLGFSLMALPALLVGVEAIRSNALERRALEALGESLGRTRSYADVENAMFDQTEAIWRHLTGLDPEARKEWRLSGEVVDYWFDRWTTELRPDELELANGVREVQRQIRVVGDSVIALSDSGRREEGYRIARQELKLRLLPTLAQLNREIYRKAREFSVQQAFARVEAIVNNERRVLLGIVLLALFGGLAGAWLITRSLARPIQELRSAMALVGAGDLDQPIAVRRQDEIGDLARAFADMTEQLRQTQAKLVQSEKLASIGEMSAAVAHGLRNPLASLRAAAQFVLKRPESPASREQLSAIIDEVDRLDRRITHLLAFSRPAPFHPVREGVTQLVEEVLPAFAQLLEHRKVELRVDLPADLPEIRVDPVQLEQSLVEIVSNALDAMPNGGRLAITGRREPMTPEGPDGVVLDVADTGGGIPDHVLPQVTKPFFTTRADGTGLGLAIAKRYVEQNGGRLELTTRPGDGTTVRIRLPSAEAPGMTPAASSA